VVQFTQLREDTTEETFSARHLPLQVDSLHGSVIRQLDADQLEPESERLLARERHCMTILIQPNLWTGLGVVQLARPIQT
jgi:hypothetical protein